MTESVKRPGRPKGLPKTGGRQKGVPNKRPSVLQILQEHKADPIRKLIELMDCEDHTIQLGAAKELAQYVHMKKSQQIEVTGTITHELHQKIEQLNQLSDDELDQIIEVEVKKLGSGASESSDSDQAIETTEQDEIVS